jgi:hypothetical protein
LKRPYRREKGLSFCHSERSEESLFDLSVSEKEQREILRFAQNDNFFGFSAASFAAEYGITSAQPSTSQDPE